MNVTKRFLSILFLFLVCCTSCKQKQEDLVADIKKQRAKIDKNLGDLTQKQVDDITSAAKGSITGYYKSDEVKKVYAEHFSDTSRVFNSYYFDDGMLIYMEEQDFKYNCSDKITEAIATANKDSVWYDDKKTRLEVSRFYFNKNKLILWEPPVINGKQTMTGSLTDKESLIWAQTAILLKELKEQ